MDAIRADKGQLSQIMMNLVVNARDAMPNGGDITLSTAAVTTDDLFCKANPSAYPGRFLEIKVSDSGEGMTKDVASRIFEPFYTTKSAGKGTGLGLSVVYGIIRELKGWIDVRSTLGEGSEFLLYIPFISEAGREQEEKEYSQQDLHGNGEWILLSEDAPAVQKYTLKILKKYGYNVLTANDLAQTRKQFEKHSDKIQLLISDVVLPDGNGVDNAAQILGANPRLKVLFLSGYTETRSRRDLIVEKGYAYLQKPFSQKDLLSAIRAVFSQ